MPKSKFKKEDTEEKGPRTVRGRDQLVVVKNNKVAVHEIWKRRVTHADLCAEFQGSHDFIANRNLHNMPSRCHGCLMYLNNAIYMVVRGESCRSSRSGY